MGCAVKPLCSPMPSKTGSVKELDIYYWCLIILDMDRIVMAEEHSDLVTFFCMCFSACNLAQNDRLFKNNSK